MSGWNAETRARSVGLGAVTVVEGAEFCICGPNGDVESDRPHGLFFRDTRVLSGWTLLVNGKPLEALSAMTPEPFRATFVLRAAPPPGAADGTLLVERDRTVGAGLREEVTVTNFGREPVTCTVELVLEVDFADIFEVKDGRPRSPRPQTHQPEQDRVVITTQGDGVERRVSFLAPDATITSDRLSYEVVVPPGQRWSRTVTVVPAAGDDPDATGSVAEGSGKSEPARRFRKWQASTPVPTLEDRGVQQVLEVSLRDLGSLRIFDAEHPDRAVAAAGVPWFMTLFGRDSLLTSLMTLPVDPSLAHGTLQTLADLQGSADDPLTEEEPGKILHEVRLGTSSSEALGGRSVYYGTVDATPLFVVALGELSRWGLGRKQVEELLPHADRALEWVTSSGDRDGDGFVEYERRNDVGLANQGWKDSWDSINFAAGELATGPIALCEVQGYVYAAYVARAALAVVVGEEGDAQAWRDRAATLKREFNDRFWLPGRGYFAIALDGDKRPVDAAASNMGHCLWSGIVDDDKAAAVAAHLLSPEMFSGWGIRTLASDMGAYNPVSYHNGSVWPHDNALIVAGLMRYGFVAEAQRVATALFEAARFFNGRLPELFCGFDRASYPEPVAYPTSCSPQAWAAATPLSLLRTLLRFEPSLATDELWIAPALPEDFGSVHLENLPLAGARVSLDLDADGMRASGLPAELNVHREPRPTSSGDW